jgi:spore maturation protein CgeB
VKVLVIEPGASWSTADVAAGLYDGLERQGVTLLRYRLAQRIERSNRWLYAAWRRAKRTQPDLEKPNTADVFYQAGVGALEMALHHQVDVVLVVSAMFLHPNVIVLMKRAGLRVVVLFTESPYDLRKELEVAALVDACWTNERSSLRAFRAVNPMSGYMPHGWREALHRPGPQPGDERVPAHDVVFVGSAFQERIDWLAAIDWTGIDLGLYGMWDALAKRHPLRPFVKGAIVTNATTAALYQHAKVGLNLYRTSMGWGPKAPHITHAESLNPRAYELAACGVFHLSTYRAEVDEIFGGLVPTFTTSIEASTLIREWLANDEGRQVHAAALPACVVDASWTARAAHVVADLQLLLQPPAAAIQHPHSQAVGAAALHTVTPCDRTVEPGYDSGSLSRQ